MRILVSLPALCCFTLAALAGCKAKSRSEGVVIDTTIPAAPASSTSAPTSASTSTAATATATPMRLADLAGRWEVRATPDSGKDTTTVRSVLVATADSTGWMTINPHGKRIPVRVVAVAGDSLVTEAGPFDSPRRKGMKVSTHTVMRREGDSLVGHIVAHFATTGPDSVLTMRAVGRREKQ
jgi:hypothetical protein